MGSMSWYTALALSVMAGIVYLFVRLAMRMLGVRTGPALACTTCGHVGQSVDRTRGSLVIEIVLWLCLLVPGLLYSLWRLTTRAKVCASCGAATLVPVGSPVGRRIVADSAAPAPLRR